MDFEYSHTDVPTSVRTYLQLRGHSVKPAPISPADRKALEKKKKKEKQELQAYAERKAPLLTSPNDGQFGDLKVNQSAYKTDRVFEQLKNVDLDKEGKKVWLRGRVDAVRAKGKMGFLVLRRGLYSIQVMVEESETVPRDMVKYVGKLPNESIIEVYGEVKKAFQKTKATQSEVEIILEKCYAVSVAGPLPFVLDDAKRQEVDGKTTDGGPSVGQELRLNYRWVDMRTPANHAIFKIGSGVTTYFRQYFLDREFVEVCTPKIIPGVSEGGSEVFHVSYFGRDACLAQSPQLYKQMASACSDLFKVFEIGPVFRAENSNTHRHMCEFTGLDFEMEIIEHYHEALKVLGDLFVYIFDKLNENFKDELKAVNDQFPFEPLKYKKETVVITHTEAVDMLKADGQKIGYQDDFTTPQEKRLGVLMRKKYDTDFYIVDRYPLQVRPFYTMPCPDDPNFTNSYDVFLRGEEITSGAQRIHDVELLKKRATECGIPHSNISSYILSFTHGAPPHAGAGIGLARVIMLFLALGNIRKSAMFPRDPLRLYP